MVMHDYRRRETVLPPKRNTFIRTDSDLASGSNKEQVIKPFKNSDGGSMLSFALR